MESRSEWDSPGPFGTTEIVPSVWDISSAVVAKEAGAKTLFLSGGAVSTNLALPDRGLMTTDYLIDLSRSIVSHTGLPLFIDGEAGFGEGPVLAWFAERLLDAGVTGIMIEDQEYSGQAYTDAPGLCTSAEMVRRIEVVAGATNNALQVIARTDIISKVAPFEDVLARLRSYRDAGANWFMAIDLRTREELDSVSDLVDGRVWVVVRRGSGYLPSLEDAQAFGCRSYLILYHQVMALTHLLDCYRKTMTGNVDEIYSGLLEGAAIARMMDFNRYLRWERARWQRDPEIGTR